MSEPSRELSAMRVVVAGGGIGALEVLAALRALAGDRVSATLLAPVTTFSFRPLSTAALFTFRGERTRRLAELAAGLGAQFVRDGLVEADDGRGRLLTQKGDLIDFDALVVAVGARPRAVAKGVDTWSAGPAGRSLFAELLRDLESGSARSAAFVVPAGAAWPVDAYELALVADLASRRSRSRARLRLVTAEGAPLEAFGPALGDAIADELERAGIELATGVEARHRRDLDVDRALFLPVVHGPGVAGLTQDDRGFIPVDAHARIVDARRCFAAGDATSLALKHSTLAARQATAAGEAIAADAGAAVTPSEWSPMLHGLLTVPPHFPGPPGSPWLESGEPVTHCLWWPPGHVAGRYLAPYLAASDPGIRPGLGWHPNGVPVDVPVDGGTRAAAPPRVPSEQAIQRDVRIRRFLAIRRSEREGLKLERDLERLGNEFERHERETIQQLEAAGYLHHART